MKLPSFEGFYRLHDFHKVNPDSLTSQTSSGNAQFKALKSFCGAAVKRIDQSNAERLKSRKCFSWNQYLKIEGARFVFFLRSPR